MKKLKIATVLFCYNRPKYLKKVLNSINEKIDFAFVDFSDKQNIICEMLGDTELLTNEGNSNAKVTYVYKRAYHYGLANNVISGLDKVYSLGYDATIFLVDDIVITNKDFFWVMRESLNEFKDVKEVGSISTHYLNENDNKRFVDWGFGTWKDRWQKVDWNFRNTFFKNKEGFRKIGSDLPRMYERAWEGKLDSWAIRFAYHCYENDLICVHPTRKRMLKHIGRIGTHHNLLSSFSVRKYLRRLKRNLSYENI